MGKCIVENCLSRSEKRDENSKVSFFEFPKDVETKLRWVKAIRKTDWAPAKFSRVCSTHFEEKCFIYSKNGIRNIKKRSIPTLNLPEIMCLNKGTQTFDEELNVKVEASTFDEELTVKSDLEECQTFDEELNVKLEDSSGLEASNQLDAPRTSTSHSMDITPSTSRPSTSQSFYSDHSSDPHSTPSTPALICSDNDSYEDIYMNNISDNDSLMRLKHEVRRLSYISEQRRRVIRCLQQNNRRCNKKIKNLKSVIDKLNEEKLPSS